MHLSQQKSCTRKMELVLEVKFYLDFHWVTGPWWRTLTNGSDVKYVFSRCHRAPCCRFYLVQVCILKAIAHSTTFFVSTGPAAAHNISIRVPHRNFDCLGTPALESQDRRTRGDWGRVDFSSIPPWREVDSCWEGPITISIRGQGNPTTTGITEGKVVLRGHVPLTATYSPIINPDRGGQTDRQSDGQACMHVWTELPLSSFILACMCFRLYLLIL